MQRPLAIAIAAGGSSRRMGTDKARMLVDGEPMLVRIARTLSPIGPLMVVGGEASLLDLLDNTGIDASHSPDLHPGEGPVGAVLTAQHSTSHMATVVVVACDLPALEASAVEHLLFEHSRTDADVTVPLVAGVAQWHLAVWNPAISATLTARFDTGERALRRIVSGLRTTFVVAGSAEMYRDLDSPADVARFVADTANSAEVSPLRPSGTVGVYDRQVPIPEITVDELAALVASDTAVSIIDVREPHEYEAGHAPGAQLIPLGEVIERVDELPAGPLHIICGSGVRSLHACEALAPLGYDVTNIAGGTGGWIAAGHAVDTGASAE